MAFVSTPGKGVAYSSKVMTASIQKLEDIHSQRLVEKTATEVSADKINDNIPSLSNEFNA